jgi:hypothetical protein
MMATPASTTSTPAGIATIPTIPTISPPGHFSSATADTAAMPLCRGQFTTRPSSFNQ